MKNHAQPPSARLQIRLHDPVLHHQSDAVDESWNSVLEWIVQNTLKASAGGHDAMDVGELESLVFLRFLTHLAQSKDDDREKGTPELALFSRPIAFFEFRLRNRRYVSIEHPADSQTKSPLGSEDRNLVSRVRYLQKLVSGRMRTLGAVPSKGELLSILFEHLNDVFEGQSDGPANTSEQKSSDVGSHGHAIHPSRRSAIANWLERMSQLNSERYQHEPTVSAHAPYPMVDGLILDNSHLALFIISPLDPNFLDEKVPASQRVSEITLGLFDIGGMVYPGALTRLVPMVKGAFARLLFMKMTEQNSYALADVFGEMGAITRYWVRVASDGIRGLLEKNLWKAPFDAFTFCSAVVERVLCADIPGVTHTEVYPFDRVIIFRHAATTDQVDDEPIEVMVIEASILSNNPADRGAFLTRRERALRETHDYECDPAKKKILPKNTFRFYIHGYSQGLILSPYPSLSIDQKRECYELRHSQSSSGPVRRGYFLGKPAIKTGNELEKVIFNLLGSLLMESRTETPAGELDFTEEFERLRLEIRQKFDEDGLYFYYDHGLDLAREVPMLYQLKETYFDYLDDKFREEDEWYIRQKYQKKLKPQELEGKLQARREERERRRTLRLASGTPGLSDVDMAQQHSSKVVYISFCSTMHDQNISLSFYGSPNGGDKENDAPLLGPEYAYTMILVADKDREKSQARLKAEREDLRMFFEMVMRQIWLDKLTEYQYLEKKRRSMDESLLQLLHRAKGMLKNEHDRQEIDNLFNGLRALLAPGRSQTNYVTVSSATQFWCSILDCDWASDHDLSQINERLRAKAESWFPGQFSGRFARRLEVVCSEIPNIKVFWSPTIVRDAFYVLLKNACEAALTRSEGKEIKVLLQIQASPAMVSQKDNGWFVEVILENTGGPIEPRLLAKLTASDPQPVRPDQGKKGSTGVGVFLSRSQLQDVIGEGADVIIANVGSNRVQSRLRLPAQLVTKSVRSSAKVPVEIPESEFVLYVEDEPRHYQQSVELLYELLHPHGLDVRHTHGCNTALDLCRRKLPCLLISDLHIPKDENDTEGGLLKNGIALLRGMMNISQQLDHRPPIWVVTAESTETVENELGDITGFGYQLVTFEKENPERICEHAMLCILAGVKRLRDIDMLQKLIENVVRNISREVIAQPIEQEAAPIPGNVYIRLSDRKWQTKLRNAHAKTADTPFSLVLIGGQADNIEQLREILRLWFTHPGLPDVDAVPGTEYEVYPLHNHVFHKRLLLAITVDAELFFSLRLQFLYWGLSHNLWFSPVQLDDETLAQKWLSLRNEARGPLSVLRHDLKNRLLTPQVYPLRQAIVEETSRCEELLLLAHDAEDELEKSLGCDDGDLPQSLFEKDTDVHRSRRKLGEHFSALSQHLQQCSEKDVELRSFVSDRLRMLHTLDSYLGAES